jgi:6-phosphofructokinase 1
VRGLREGFRVFGIRRGWAGLVDLIPEPGLEQMHNFLELTDEIVSRAARTGGTFLHTSRTRLSHLPRILVPDHV